MTSLIIGARTEEQLADNLAAAELKLVEELERLDKVSAPPLHLPLWHQAKTAAAALPRRPRPCSGATCSRASAASTRVRGGRRALLADPRGEFPF